MKSVRRENAAGPQGGQKVSPPSKPPPAAQCWVLSENCIGSYLCKGNTAHDSPSLLAGGAGCQQCARWEDAKKCCSGYGCCELSQLELPDTRKARQFREG